MPTINIKEIGDFTQFIGLKDWWNDLLSQGKDNDVFSTWEWLSNWWKHFGQGRELRILIAEEDGQAIAVAPLMCSKYNFARLGNLTKMEFIGNLQSDYNSFILVRKELECVKLFLNYLLVNHNDWDCLELKDVSETTATMGLLRNLSREQPSAEKFEERVTFLCPYIELPNSVEEFLQRMKGDMRRSLRRRMRRLSEQYEVKVKTQNDFGSIKEAMNAFYGLHQKRWGNKGIAGVFAEETLRNFHYDVANQFNENGWLRLHVLTANDKPIASIYSFNYRAKKYEYLTGFDPEFSQYGVGNLLRMHVVEDCIREGIKEYDLMRGDEPYKSFWSIKARKNFEVRLTRKGFFAKIYAWAIRNPTTSTLMQKLRRSLTLKH